MIQESDSNWWSRNWKWVVPVGCLGALILFAGFIIAILGLVFGVIKSSDVYKDALVIAKNDSSVQQAIGTPIEDGLFLMGSINVSGSSGHADLSIPVSGPEGKATIYVVADKSAGQWVYSTLVVKTKESRQRINLLE